jgi:hypothetical protein
MKKLFLPLLVLLIVLGSLGSSYYFYSQNNAAQKLLKDPTAASKEEIKKVTLALSKFMDLPVDEEPTLATVLDKEKIKDQPFFAKAENGDKVIIYTKSGKAILFRPSTGRIIDIAPINLGESQGTVNIVVLNGTPTAGLAKTFSTAIKAQATNVNVLAEDTAKNTNYPKSIVVDLTGKKAELAKQMADLIGGEVSTLPAGEVAPVINDKTVDLLVIVGANMKITEATPTPSAAAVTPIPSVEVTPTPTPAQ